MARRNRKKKVNGFIFPVPFAAMVVLVSALALTYVWLGCQCESVGEEIKTLETRGRELHKEYLNASYRWTRAKSPGNLERALDRCHIPMDWPQAGQVVRLGDPRSLATGGALEGVKVAQLRRTARNE
jgi:hypothetical protein